MSTLIIGSGVAAVAVARRALQNNPGLNITLLEAGGVMPIANYRKWLDFTMSGVAPTTEFEDLSDDIDVNKDGGLYFRGGRMLSKGGSTNHWGGWCLRMKPEDFHLGDIDKRFLNWSIPYQDLSPYYEQAEHFLHVCGDHNSQSIQRNGARYRYEAIPFTALDTALMPALNSLGISYEPLPVARNPQRCRTTGTCVYCPFDARYAAASDLDALLLEFPGRVELKVQSPIHSIVMKDKKTAAGILYTDPSHPEPIFLEADRVIVAAGTIESTKLLLTSTSQYWHEGIGNDTHHLGRHLNNHPMIKAKGLLKHNPNHHESEINIPTLLSRHFDSEEHQALGKMLFVRYGPEGAISIEKHIKLGHSIKQINAALESETPIELRGMLETFPDEGNFIGLAPGKTQIGLPRTHIQYKESADAKKARKKQTANLMTILECADLKAISDISYWGSRTDHLSSTCRMSLDANLGVVDSNLRVHDTENLYVCSNAVFPNMGAANPTLTLVSLALRLGDYLENTEASRI